MDNPVAYTIEEFCEVHRISKGHFYKLKKLARGPRVMDLAATEYDRCCPLPRTRFADRGRRRQIWTKASTARSRVGWSVSTVWWARSIRCQPIQTTLELSWL